MNGQLAKENRRNLRKEIGATATDALERARHEVLQLRLANGVLAKEVDALKALVTSHAATLVNESQRLNVRIDGVAAWCEKNESAIAVVRRDYVPHDVLVRLELLRWHQVSVRFRARLRWILFGTVRGE